MWWRYVLDNQFTNYAMQIMISWYYLTISADVKIAHRLFFTPVLKPSNHLDNHVVVLKFSKMFFYRASFSCNVDWNIDAFASWFFVFRSTFRNNLRNILLVESKESKVYLLNHTAVIFVSDCHLTPMIFHLNNQVLKLEVYLMSIWRPSRKRPPISPLAIPLEMAKTVQVRASP